MLLGEENSAVQGSGLASVYYDNDNHNSNNGNTPLTPPYDDYPIGDEHLMSRHGFDARGVTGNGSHRVDSWIELWDYVGGTSFRGVVAEDMETGDKTLMIFFDEQSVEGRDLKKAYVVPLCCSFPSPFPTSPFCPNTH